MFAITVTVSAPDDVNRTDVPIYDGDPDRAHMFLVPGVYPATRTITFDNMDDDISTGVLVVWSTACEYPMLTGPVSRAGSIYIDNTECGFDMCGGDAHHHTADAYGF